MDLEAIGESEKNREKRSNCMIISTRTLIGIATSEVWYVKCLDKY